ncbi:hypothetical protein ACTXT7_011556 [Hymenolepis weldensis]
MPYIHTRKVDLGTANVYVCEFWRYGFEAHLCIPYKDTLPCLLQIILGCIRQNFVSGEITLDGLWEDLSGLLSDLIQRVHEYLQESPTASELLQYSNDVLHCLTKIEEGNDEMRNAFVRCCLYRRVRVMTEREGEISYNSNSSTVVEVLRGQLVFVCQRLHLPRLLEFAGRSGAHKATKAYQGNLDCARTFWEIRRITDRAVIKCGVRAEVFPTNQR